MTKEKFGKVYIYVLSICCVILMVVMVWGIFTAYKMGIDKGREETVQMVTDFTDKYNFNEIQSKENGGIMACFGSTKYFPNSNNTLLNCYYDWDGSLKISLKDVTK